MSRCPSRRAHQDAVLATAAQLLGRGIEPHEVRDNALAGAMGRLRGAQQEQRVFDLLRDSPHLPWWVIAVRRATPDEDALGADVVVETDIGALHVQVKSSGHAATTWREKLRLAGRLDVLERVGIVVSPPALTDATIMGRALGVLIVLRERAEAAHALHQQPAMKLFLDDIRPAPNASWTIVRTLDEAKAVLLASEVDELSLDHDLDVCPICHAGLVVEQDQTDALPPCIHPVTTGLDLLRWMHETGRWPRTKPVVFSSNQDGAAAMRQFIDEHWPGSR
jgi:hypothetical protein